MLSLGNRSVTPDEALTNKATCTTNEWLSGAREVNRLEAVMTNSSSVEKSEPMTLSRSFEWGQ